MEYGEATVGLEPGPGEERLIELAPRRIYDAAARGWYGGDMHVHLNWAGDLVGAPADAAVAQHGEDLHVLDLLAGNVSGRRVYDREALERWTDVDLPWSDATHVGQDGRRIPQRPARPHLRVRAARRSPTATRPRASCRPCGATAPPASWSPTSRSGSWTVSTCPRTPRSRPRRRCTGG